MRWWFKRKSLKSSDLISTMLKEGVEDAEPPCERGAWDDGRVSFDTYWREERCLRAFTIFYGIIASKLSDVDKRTLLAKFEDQTIKTMGAAFYRGIHEYYDAFVSAPIANINPLSNIGAVFACHCGADRDFAYEVSAVVSFPEMLRLTVELLNQTAMAYTILR